MSKSIATPPTTLAEEIGKRQPFASLRQEAYLNLVRTHEKLSSEIEQLLKSHGLSDAQFNALRILRGEGKPMQVYQIADRMVSPQTDISRLVDRLAKSDFIERERSEQDRRVVWVTLSEQGRAVLKGLDRPLQKLHEAQFQDFNDLELQTLSSYLFRARK